MKLFLNFFSKCTYTHTCSKYEGPSEYFNELIGTEFSFSWSQTKCLFRGTHEAKSFGSVPKGIVGIEVYFTTVSVPRIHSVEW
jgi:hypothetical protein